MLFSQRIQPTGALNRTVNSIVGLTVPAGASVWPHTLDMVGPAPLIAGSLIMASLHLVDENGQASFGVSIDSIDPVNVNLVNSLGVAQDVKIEVVLWHPHYGLSGALVPAAKHWDTSFTNVLAAANATPGPFNLTDGPPVILIPLMLGLAPDADPYWCRVSDPPLDGNPTIYNDNPGAAMDINVTAGLYHSPQRVLPPVATARDDLYHVQPAPVSIAPTAFADFNPGPLLEGGLAVLPDISWPVVVGSTAAGVALAAPTFLRLDAYVPNQIRYTNLNALPGEDVTIYVASLRVHTAVRVP